MPADLARESRCASPIATVCLSGTLEEKLGPPPAAGFDGVEIFENDLVSSPLAPGRGPRAAPTSSGLRIELYQPFRDFEAVPPNCSRATCAGPSASSS